MDEKYVITIDGPDCTGKSTLWLNANEYNKNIQIRGIVSNIAYAIKFGRNVDELLELYNQNPVNYVVYLLNPNNDKKLEMLYNRIRNNMIYDNDKIVKELEDASKTWKDKEFFDEAIKLLNNKYNGKIEVIYNNDNNFNTFKEQIKNYNIQEIEEIIPNPAIKVLNVVPNEFEAKAKTESEFKYIVFINKISKEEIMDNLYNGLDDEHKKMYDTLIEYGQDGNADIYDCLEYHTPDELAAFLENYEFRCDVNIRVDIDTDMECYIPLKDFCEDNDRCLEDYIYNDSNLMDEVLDCAQDALRYSDDFEINVERVR